MPTPTPTAVPTPTPQPTLPPSATGVNPWWTYEEGAIPGVGKWMLNVANGNMLVQSDDVDVPERGIDLAFRRTYNSQSQHNAANGDGSIPSLFGNGWTNTFDAHLGYNASSNIIYVYDIDGARYDYTSDSQGNWVAPPGQHATLALDSSNCYYNWAKKTGTVYTFWTPYASCGTAQGYWGRNSQILGRNHDNNILFTYSWNNNDASNFANVTQIVAKHSDTQQLALTFAKFGAFTELWQVTRPDGLLVSYSYDASGNLLEVDRPAAPSVQVRTFATSTGASYTTTVLPEAYAYAAGVLTSVTNPRALLASRNGQTIGGNPAEGMAVAFGYDASNRVNLINDWGITNYMPNDGTSAILQSGADSSWHVYRQEQVAYGLNNAYSQPATQISDADGHTREWGFDTTNRAITTQEWVNSTLNIVTKAAWDSDNNLIATTDARGNETDYTYDGNGNTTQVMSPSVPTSMGTLRPTSRYVYNPKTNNLLAYCDPVYNATHSTCVQGAGVTYYIWDSSDPTAPADANEPFGRLTDTYTPLGYHTQIAYNTSIGDVGLPSDVTTPVSIPQADGTQLQPQQHFTYDQYGNLSTYSKGYGSWTLAYDAMNRMVSATDPDNVTSRMCYNVEGTIYAKQSAYQYSLDGGASCGSHSDLFTYDADGNDVSDTRHLGQTAANGVPNGVTQKWYDGDDRLIEVLQPSDANVDQNVPWRTRYNYDLSKNQQVSITLPAGGSASYYAHGNLYKTQHYFATPTYAWVDVNGNALDALDRSVARYQPVPHGPLETWTSVYDAPGQEGLLSSKTDPVSTTTTLQYDALGHTTSTVYSDGTANKTMGYDPDGHLVTQASSAFSIPDAFQYDADGREMQYAEGSGAGTTAPATITYSYYPNGLRSALSISSSALTQTNQLTYSYRNDGLRTKLAVAGYNQPFAWSYTSAGRESSQSDPLTGTTSPAVTSGADTLFNSFNYVPRTSSYDAFGHLATLTLPNTGAYTNITYSVEDEMMGAGIATPLGATQPADLRVNGQSSYITSVNENYDIRGEFISEMGFSQVQPNGAYGNLPIYYCYGHNSDDVTGTSCGNVDASTGAASQANNVTVKALQTAYCKTNGFGDYSDTASWNFDADGRQSSSAIPAPDTTCYTQPTTVESRTYDAEDHTLTDQCFYTTVEGGCGTGSSYSLSYVYGPNGRVRQFGSNTLHWDGDRLLFISDSSGNLVQQNVEQLGAIMNTAPSHLTIFDRDVSGQEAAVHSTATLVSQYGTAVSSNWLWIIMPSRFSQPTYSQQVTVVQSCFPLCTNGSVHSQALSTGGIDGTVAYDSGRTDGYRIGAITVQGVRAYDPVSQQWSTPDAYKGTVHDPMSQRSYMWNNNNPLAYADPSGYDAFLGFDPGGANGFGHAFMVVYGSLNYGELFSWDLSFIGAIAFFNAKIEYKDGPVRSLSDPWNQSIRGFHLASTPAQDQRMLAYWHRLQQIQSNPALAEHYNLISNNCIEQVAGALIAAGNDGGHNLADIGRNLALYPNLAISYLLSHGYLPENIADLRTSAGSGVYTSGWTTKAPSL
jgi:YD repeat-containing protein